MASNEFALAARAKKVRALVMYFDIELPRNHNIHPLKEPKAAADKLRSLTDLQWREHAIIAGQRPPSETTKTDIIAVYEVRVFAAENVVQLRSGRLN